MGLFDRLRGIKDPVPGTYRLVSCSYSSGGAAFENCTMDGVVTAPGIPPTAVHHVSLLTPTAKWPQPGQELPVTIEAGKPDRLKIHWDQVPSAAQIARSLAEQEAAAQRSADTPADPAPQSAVLSAPGRPLPGTPGGGLSPQESAQVAAGGAAALGLQPMTGTVIAAHQLEVPASMPQAPGGTWDLTLDVTPPAGPGFTTVLRIGFSSPTRKTEIASIGRVLPVVSDPAHPDRIAIDTTRLN
jgi:hypothetical protein